ncbi:MAG: hypothetical protein IJF84_09900 [Thermoguttaceae bacterium]|nr:hypothetical protein [Thermoguttaceae bacterium]
MRLLGILITFGALVFIGYNIYMCNECTKIANDHPIMTVMSMGTNLPNEGNYYSFRSPLSNVEIGVLIALGIGVLLTLFGGLKKAPDNSSSDSNKSA